MGRGDRVSLMRDETDAQRSRTETHPKADMARPGVEAGDIRRVPSVGLPQRLDAKRVQVVVVAAKNSYDGLSATVER